MKGGLHEIIRVNPYGLVRLSLCKEWVFVQIRTQVSLKAPHTKARLVLFNIRDWIKAHHTEDALKRIERSELIWMLKHPDDSTRIEMQDNVMRKRYLRPLFALKKEQKSNFKLSSNYMFWFSFNMTLSYLRKSLGFIKGRPDKGEIPTNGK